MVITPRSGSKLINIYANGSINQKGYLISPFISDLDNKKRIKFYLTSFDSQYIDTSLTIGTMSNPQDESTFVPLENILPENINQFNGYKVNGYLKEHIIYFNNYNSSLNHNYIAFKVNHSVNTNNSIYFFIDDFTYENSPLCKEPTNLKCTRTDYNYANVKWDVFDQSSSEWEIEYGISGFKIGTGKKISANSNTFTINSNLIQSQEYDFYVRTKCGSNYSNWSDRGTFKTKCSGFNAGYKTSFENEDFQTGNTCWSRITPDIRDVYYNQNYFIRYEKEYNSNGVIPKLGTSMMEIFSSKSIFVDELVNEKTILVSPRFNDFNSDKKISFYAHLGHDNYSTVSKIEIGTLSDIEDYTSFTPYEAIDSQLLNNQWKEYTVDFSRYKGSDKYIGIRVFATGNYNERIFIDDFKYLQNDCNKPSNLKVNQLTSNSVELNWKTNMNNPVNCELEYGPLGFTSGTGTTINVTSLPIKISNLNSNSSYEYRVRNICNTPIINWSNTYAFKISCAKNVPFEESFDNYTATNFEYIPEENCWSVSSLMNDQTNAYVSKLYCENFNSSPNVFELHNYSEGNNNDLYLISPFLIDFDSNKRIKFWINKNKYYNQKQTYVIGTLSNPLDLSTFVPYKTFNTDDLPLYGKEINIDFSTYNGSNKYVAIKLLAGDISNIVYIDDFKYLETPNCIEPINIQFLNITDNSTLIKWNDVSGLNVEIEYGLSGFKLGTGSTVSNNLNQILISGLNNSSKYDFYLKTKCSESLSSTVVKKVISTSCKTQTLPWVENFADLPSYGIDMLPNCMEVIFGGIESFNKPKLLYSNFYKPDHTLDGNGDNSYLLLNKLHPHILTPPFELISGVTYKFSVDGRKRYEYSGEGLILYVGKGRNQHYMKFETVSPTKLSEYNYNTKSFYYTPIETGIYSFILAEESGEGDAYMIVDNFKLSEGYDEGIVNNNESFDFQTGIDSKVILENSTICPLLIQNDENNILNKLIKMYGSGVPENWKDTTPDNIWESNQNHITKVNMKINATTISSLFMSFDLKQTFNDYSNESMFRVVVNGIVLGNVIRPETNNQDALDTFQYDLTPFVGGDIRISLQHIGKSYNSVGDNAFLDNLNFSPMALLSTNENNFTRLRYNPNPVNDFLNIENDSTISSVEISTVTGQSIFYKNYLTNKVIVDTNNFVSGLYFVKITSENKTLTLKIIKE